MLVLLNGLLEANVVSIGLDKNNCPRDLVRVNFLVRAKNFPIFRHAFQ